MKKQLLANRSASHGQHVAMVYAMIVAILCPGGGLNVRGYADAGKPAAYTAAIATIEARKIQIDSQLPARFFMTRAEAPRFEALMAIENPSEKEKAELESFVKMGLARSEELQKLGRKKGHTDTDKARFLELESLRVIADGTVEELRFRLRAALARRREAVENMYGEPRAPGLSAIQGASPSSGNMRVVVQNGHSAEISDLDFSGDGKLLLSGSDDGSIVLWEVASRRQVQVFRRTRAAEQVEVSRHIDADNPRAPGIMSVALSLDGRFAAQGDLQGDIAVWNTVSGVLEKEWHAHSGSVQDVRFSPDGRLVASAAMQSGEFTLWDFVSGRALWKLRGGAVRRVAFSPDGQTIAAGCGDGSVYLVRTADGSQVKRLRSAPKGRIQTVRSISYASTGNLIAALILDKPEGMEKSSCSIQAWNTKGKLLRETPALYSDMRDASLTKDGGSVVATSLSGPMGLVRLSIESGKLESFGRANLPTRLALSPDGRTVATATNHSGDFSIYLGNLGSNEEPWKLLGNGREASLTFSPSGRWMAVKRFDGTFKLWDFPHMRPVGTTRPAREVVFSPDDSMAAIVFRPLRPRGAGENTNEYPEPPVLEKPLEMWSLPEGRKIWAFSKTVGMAGVAWSPDGKTLAVGGPKGARIFLVDAATGKGGKTLDYPDKGLLDQERQPGWRRVPMISGLVFSADGKRLLAHREQQGVGLWDVESQRLLWEVGVRGGSMVFSRTGKIYLASRGVGEIDEATQKVTDIPELGPAGQIAVSPDGRWLAAGRYDGSVLLWDTSSNRLVRTLEKHTKGITSLKFSSDGQLLLSGDAGGTAYAWRVDDGTELARVLADADNYVAALPTGQYAASRNAVAMVALCKDLRAYGFEQFDVRLNRPDLVFEAFQAPAAVCGTYRAAYSRRLRQLKLTESQVQTDSEAPTLTVAQPPPLSTTVNKVTFKIRAQGGKDALKSILVWTNNVPVFGRMGLDVSSENANVLDRSLEVDLTPGLNKIEVSAVNDKGVESLRELFAVSANGPTERPNLYVVTVGISKYRDERFNLKYSAKDATDISSYFTASPGRFGEVKTLSLLNEEATRQGIESARTFLAPCRAVDTVVVLLSGHGFLMGNLNYYYAPYDFQINDIAGTAVPYDRIEELLDSVRARDKLLLLDTCHAGQVDSEAPAASRYSSDGVSARAVRGIVVEPAFAASTPTVSLDVLREVFVDLQRGSGTEVIAAASGLDFAFERDEWKNGVFTYSVLDGLKNGVADGDNDETITVSELRDFVSRRVLELTRGAQKPMAREENLDNDFAVALAPKKPVPPPVMAPRDASGLRFDGMYVFGELQKNVLRFFPGGSVVCVPVTGPPPVSMRPLSPLNPRAFRGRWTTTGDRLEFSLTAADGLLVSKGTVAGDRLKVSLVMPRTGKVVETEYYFIDMSATMPPPKK